MSVLKEVNSISSISKLNEGKISPEITMTLDQVIVAGKVTNSIQYQMIASVLQAVICGNASTTRTSGDLMSYGSYKTTIDYIRSLDAKTLVALAMYLKNTIETSSIGTCDVVATPCQLSAQEWVQKYIAIAKNNN